MLLNLFDAIFRAVAPFIAVFGVLLTCFYLTVMFDDKCTYTNSGRSFLKWLGSAGSSAISEIAKENSEKNKAKED